MKVRVAGIALMCAFLIANHAPAGAQQPEAGMLAVAEAAAAFVDTQDENRLKGVFASDGVVIVDNFPPYLFTGPGAVALWAAGVRDHLVGITDLQHVFGEAHEYSRRGDSAYFSLPVTWYEHFHGKPVVEHGAWVFVMVRENGVWRIKSSIWGRVYSTAH